MSKIDWSKLANIPKGLAVEGKDDKFAIEAFLDIGEDMGHWQNWRTQIMIEDAGDSAKAIAELAQQDSRIWALIDRDWRTDTEISELQKQYSQLLILPRVTIENYCIAPAELDSMLPAAKSIPSLDAKIEYYKDDWVQNGALWQTLHENRAHDFCRGHEDGYPKALLHQPVTDQNRIESQFRSWYDQLDPSGIMRTYRTRLSDFRADEHSNYTRHIHGKHFFHQVVSQILNQYLGTQKADKWFKDLFSALTQCPPDIVPILQRVVF